MAEDFPGEEFGGADRDFSPEPRTLSEEASARQRDDREDGDDARTEANIYWQGVLMNPYLAGGLFLDYVTRSRFPSVPEHPPLLMPDHVSELTLSRPAPENPDIPAAEESGAGNASGVVPDGTTTDPGLKEIDITHE